MEDIYFEPDYGKLYENMENGERVFYEHSNEYGTITNLFIKRKIPIDLKDGITYFDITTPYGYGGPIINNVVNNNKKKLIDSYITSFNKYCKENNIITEFIRFHPVINNASDFEKSYVTTFLRNTVGTNLSITDNPILTELSKSARKNVRKSLKKGVTYEVDVEPSSLDDFIEIYYSTMNRNQADDYYYFSKDYFENALKYFKKNIITVKAFYEDQLIAMGFYFKYKKYLHTHLSGTLSEYLYLSPAYVLRHALIEWGKENNYNLIHHGGGKTNNKDDGLYKFKERFSKDTKFEFYIGKKIWNEQVYIELCNEVDADKDQSYFPAYRN